MQEEISHLKVIINNMQNQINTLSQELEMSQETNNEEVVKVVEEVPVKRMDRPSATETERGRASEMNGQKSAIKHGNATEIDQMY